MYDYSKLLGKIKEVCGTLNCFADMLHVSRTTISLRVNNKAQFSQEEMFDSCKILGIEFSEIHKYFFDKKVQKSEQNNDD